MAAGLSWLYQSIQKLFPKVTFDGPISGSTSANSPVALRDTIIVIDQKCDFVVIMAGCAYNDTPSTANYFGVQLNADGPHPLCNYSQPPSAANYYMPFAGVYIFQNISPGTYHIYTTWYTSSGTLSDITSYNVYLEIRKP